MAGQADGSIIVDTEIDATGFKADSAELQRAIKSLNTKVENLGPTLQKALSGSASALSTFDSKAAALENTISELETKLESLGEKRVPTEDYQWLTTEIEKAKNELSKLEEKQIKMEDLGVKENSKSWQSLQYDIDLAKRKIADYEAEQATMRDAGTAFLMGSDTAEYAQLESALAAARDRLAEMRAQAASLNTTARGFIDTLQNAAPLSERLKNALSGVLGVASRVGGAFRSVGSAILNSVAHPLHTLNQGIGSVISGLGYIGKKGVQGFGKLISGIKAGISKLNEFRKSSAGCGSAIKNLGKKITGITSMLKRMVLRKLLMAMITAVKEGFSNLAQYSNQTNADLSKLKSGLTQLKNSFATAFAPILTAVTPILATLINYLSSALTYIGKLFAALTGAKTFTKATAVQEDYAASLGETGKAADEAKRQLAGFDDLNVLSDSSSKDSGGSAGGASPSEMFEEVPIESSITDFVGKIKDAFKKGDYASIGEIIGTKINDAVQKVNDFIKWDNVGSKVTKAVSGVAEGFNALTHTINWTLIGDTLAQGFNTALNTLFLIITKFDWPGLAAGLMQGLNGLVTGIDWSLLGTTLSTGMRTLLATLRSAITTFDWAALGKGVADGINSIDFVGILSDLAGGISDILSGALDLLLGFAYNLDWGKLGSDLWNGLVGIVTNIDWGGLISKAFELLGAALAGAVKLIVGFAQSLWESLKNAFNSTKEYFAKYIDEAGGNVIMGLLNGIWNGIKNIGTWIKEHIFDPFINGFKKVFGIHSPSTVMSEMGGMLIEGLLNGIKNLWSGITSFFSNALSGLKNLISNAWNGIKSVASSAWNGIKNTISGAWDGIKSGVSSACSAVSSVVSNAWNGIKSAASSAWSTVKSTVSNAWSNIKSGVSSACSAVGSAVSSAWTNVKNHISNNLNTAKTIASNAWNSIKSTASTIGSNIASAASSAWTSIKNHISNNLNNAKTLASNAWNSIKSTASTIGSNIASSVSSAWTNVKNSISNSLNNAKTAASNAWNSIKSTASTVGSSIASAASSAWSNVKNYISNNLNNAKTAASNAWNSIKSTASSISDSIKSKVSSAWDSLKSTVSSKLSGIKDSVSSTFSNLKNNASTWGKDLCSNMANGIKNAASAVGNAVQSVASKIKSFLGFSEPEDGPLSDFHTYMPDMLELMASGIKQNQGKALGAVSGLASAISSEIQNGDYSLKNANIGAGIGGTLDSFSDKIVDGFDRLIDRLHAIADGVTFATPAVATSGVVPYSVSASAAGAASGNIGGVIETSNDELASVVTQVVTNAASAIVGAIREYSGTTVNLDAESLTTQVIKDINRRTKMRGSSPLVG